METVSLIVVLFGNRGATFYDVLVIIMSGDSSTPRNIKVVVLVKIVDGSTPKTFFLKKFFFLPSIFFIKKSRLAADWLNVDFYKCFWFVKIWGYNGMATSRFLMRDNLILCFKDESLRSPFIPIRALNKCLRWYVIFCLLILEN